MSSKYLSYGSHFIDKKDIKAVSKALKNKLITSGSLVQNFEKKISKYLGVKYSTVCSSGTSALHMAFNSIKLSTNDVVLMPVITFIASYSMAKLFGAKVYLVDIDLHSGQMTPETIENCIIKNNLKNIKCLVTMHLGGYPKNIEDIYKLKIKHNFIIIEDACHAFGAEYKYKGNFLKIGSCKHSDIACFSFHPLKTITTGEGGALTTNNKIFQKSFVKFRSHGFVKKNHWNYELENFGFNYRLSDISCALGISQLEKVNKFLNKRKKIYEFYEKKLKNFSKILNFIKYDSNVKPSYHLFVIFIKKNNKYKKEKLIKYFLDKNISVQQHYKPIFKFKVYNEKNKIKFINSNKYFHSAISLPIHFNMNKKDLNNVIINLKNYFKLSY